MSPCGAKDIRFATVTFLLVGVPETSNINNSSSVAGAAPIAVLPAISSPTTGTGPVALATSIPNRFSVVEALTPVISPDVVLSNSQLLPVPVATYTPGFVPVL